jgi:hypothetical protein
MSRFVRVGAPALIGRERTTLARSPQSKAAHKIRQRFADEERAKAFASRAKSVTESADATVEDALRSSFATTRGVRDQVKEFNAARKSAWKDEAMPWGEYTAENASTPQRAFDALFVRAILDYAPPEKTSFRLHEIFQFMQRADPSFSIQKFGTTNFGMLVKFCDFADVEGGFVHVERRFDESDPPKAIGLRPQSFRFVGENSPIQTKPPEFDPRDLRWT